MEPRRSGQRIQFLFLQVNKVNNDLSEKLNAAIGNYRLAIAANTSNPASADYLAIARTAESLNAALKQGGIASANLNVYAFSRQVTDSNYKQIPDFEELSHAVSEVRKMLKRLPTQPWR